MILGDCLPCAFQESRRHKTKSKGQGIPPIRGERLIPGPDRMSRLRLTTNDRRSRLIALDAEIRACRRCRLAGYLDERESIPIARDPEPDAPVPRILLIGQAPGLRATLHDRPFAGIAGEKLRDWLELGGIPREDFYRKVHLAAIT